MRLIDADALIDFIDCGHLRNPLESCFSERDVVDMLESRPTISAVPVVRGEWMPTDMGGGETDEAYVCSACGEPWTLNDGTPAENNMHYCPNCGAKMEDKP